METDGFLPAPIRFGRGAPRWPISDIVRIEAEAAADRGSETAQ
jgi:hypothetical protein